jgi:hypothetical protein
MAGTIRYGGDHIDLNRENHKCGHSLSRKDFRKLLQTPNGPPKCPYCGTVIPESTINYFNTTVDGADPKLDRYYNPPVISGNEAGRLAQDYLNKRQAHIDEFEAYKRGEWKPSLPPQPKGWFGGWFGFGSKNKVHQDIKYLKSIK